MEQVRETGAVDGAATEIAARALASADRFLTAAELVVTGIAREFRDGHTREGLAELTRLLDGVVSLARLAQDLGTLLPQGPPVAIEEFRDTMRQIVALEESASWATLADVLEQDLAPRLARWRAAFAL